MSILSFLYKNTNFRRAHPLSPMSCVLSRLTAVFPSLPLAAAVGVLCQVHVVAVGVLCHVHVVAVGVMYHGPAKELLASHRNQKVFLTGHALARL